MFFWDWSIFLVIPPFILAIYAQSRVKNTYAKFSRIPAASRITGAEAARRILSASAAGNVPVERTKGRLSDHYDPRKKVLRLSEGVHDSQSLSALGIAAHEAGHAIQHAQGYVPLQLRNTLFPVANLGSTLAFPLFFIGFLFSRNGPSILMDIGILLFAGAVVFSVLTLPVEFDASKKAMVLLRDTGFLRGEELNGAKSVLSAAALTYVASTAMAAMQLVRMFILRGSRD
ncbi:MAG: zinc metallopeptidase [Candidatus Aminicenantes bacterium]|nr:zinc metallopeptidase [Candidatus Aminicenantes bacterium]